MRVLHAAALGALSLAVSTMIAGCGGSSKSPYFSRVSTVQVIDSTPAMGASGVPLDSKIEVEFGQEIDLGTLSTGLVLTSGSQAAEVPGTVKSYASRVATLTLPRLSPATVYTIRIHGLTDTEGRPLADQSWTFTTEPLPAPPALLAYVPGNGDNAVALNFRIRITFTGPIAPPPSNAFKLRYNGGTQLFTTAVLDAEANEIVVTPTVLPTSNDNVTLEAVQPVKDLDGQIALPAGTLETFQVGNATDVTRPALGAGISVTASGATATIHLPSVSDDRWGPDAMRWEATVSRRSQAPLGCGDPFDPRTIRVAEVGSSGTLTVGGLSYGYWDVIVTAEDGSGRVSMPSSPAEVTIASNPVLFSTNVKPVMDTRCALVGCHAGSSPSGTIYLDQDPTTEVTYLKQKVASYAPETLTEIEPFCLEKSYLWRKIVPGYPIAGGLQPPAEADLQQLSRRQIETLREWIEEGAD
jgi:hypothetical protein